MEAIALKKVMLDHGCKSGRDLAERTGLNRGVVQCMLSGNCNPSLSNVAKLIKGLKITTNEMYLVFPELKPYGVLYYVGR